MSDQDTRGNDPDGRAEAGVKRAWKAPTLVDLSVLGTLGGPDMLNMESQTLFGIKGYF